MHMEKRIFVLEVKEKEEVKNVHDCTENAKEQRKKYYELGINRT